MLEDSESVKQWSILGNHRRDHSARMQCRYSPRIAYKLDLELKLN